MEPFLVLSIIYGVGAIYGIYLIFESRRETKEMFLSDEEEEILMMERYYKKYPEKKPE